MDRFVIEGPTRLEGELAVGGAKNAVLPLMAAALLGRGTTVIENVPDLHDVRFFMTILEGLGATCSLVGISSAARVPRIASSATAST